MKPRSRRLHYFALSLTLLTGLAPRVATPQSCLDYTDYIHIEGSLAAPSALLAVEGAYAYLAAGTSGLLVVDISDPSAPLTLGSTLTARRAEDVAVSGSYAYVADADSGLTVVDISDPMVPTMVAGLALTDWANHVVVRGDHAFVTEFDFGMHVVDISSPAAPVIAGSVETPSFSVGIDVEGDYAYIGDGFSGLQVIDVSDPTDPRIVGSVPPLGAFEGLVVEGSYAYVASHESGFTVIDVSDPADPQITSNIGNELMLDVALAGNLAYVTEPQARGFVVIDVSNPAAPVERATFPLLAVDIVAMPPYLLVSANSGGLYILEAGNSLVPDRVGRVSVGESRGQHRVGNLIYVAAGQSLQVVNAANPLAPQVIGSEAIPGDAEDVFVFASRAYVAYSNTSGVFQGGLQIVDVANPANPFSEGNVAFVTPALGVVTSGDYAYVANEVDGLRVVNVSQPLLPVEVASEDTPGIASDVALVGSVAYVANGPLSLEMIDVSDPMNPMAALETIPVTGRRLAVDGDLLYVAGGAGGLAIVDLNNPTSPEPSGVPTFGSARGVAVADDMAYVATTAGLEIVDVSDVDDLGRVGMALPGGMEDASVVQDHVFVSYDQFVDVFETQCEIVIAVTPLEVPLGPLQLHSARPNPILTSTEIGFEIPVRERVTLRVYGVGGRLVRTLIESELAPGAHRVAWDGHDDLGRAVAAGVYVYRLDAGRSGLSRKLTLLR